MDPVSSRSVGLRYGSGIGSRLLKFLRASAVDEANVFKDVAPGEPRSETHFCIASQQAGYDNEGKRRPPAGVRGE